MYVCFDELINHAAYWSYTFGGTTKIPLVVRTLVGRGWGQASQHSQSLQAIFNHIPGFRVVMPSSSYDAKGLLLYCLLRENNPVIFIENRILYDEIGEVPEESFEIPLGQANIVKEGKDVTVLADSYMVLEARRADNILKQDGIDVEIIDLRSIKPWDKEKIFNSVKKTGRLLIADAGWKTGGVGAEIAAAVAENIFSALKAPIRRVCLPDAPVPCSAALQKIYYPGPETIISAVHILVKAGGESPEAFEELSKNFQGPF